MNDTLDLDGKDAAEILSLFKTLDTFSDIKRFFILLWADEKQGKTHVIYTSSELVPENPKISPELREMLQQGKIVSGSPTWIIDTEGKAKKLARKFAGRDVRILDVWVPDANNPTRCDVKKSLKNVILAVVAMSVQPCGTLAIDSWSDIDRWCRKMIQYDLAEGGAEGSELGELIRLQPTDWEVRGDVETFLLYYIQNCIPNMHVILTSRADFEWAVVPGKNGKDHLKRTGNMKKKMYKDTGYFADCEIRLMKDDDEDGNVTRIGKLITSEYDEEEPISLEWENPTFPKIVDSLKDLALKQVKAAHPPAKKAAKKAAKKKPKKVENDGEKEEE